METKSEHNLSRIEVFDKENSVYYTLNQCFILKYNDFLTLYNQFNFKKFDSKGFEIRQLVFDKMKVEILGFEALEKNKKVIMWINLRNKNNISIVAKTFLKPKSVDFNLLIQKRQDRYKIVIGTKTLFQKIWKEKN